MCKEIFKCNEKLYLLLVTKIIKNKVKQDPK